MSHRERTPTLAPRGLVLCTWVQQVAAQSAPYEHSAAPDGCLEIVCRPGSVPSVLGPRTRPSTETLVPGTTVVGARLQPGVGPTVLGVAASELLDASVPLDQLWGPSALRLGERIAEAGSTRRAEAVLERTICDQLDNRSRPDRMVQAAVAMLTRSDEPVVSLASTLDLSPRQLHRRCVHALGFGPKTLQRILRFQRFLTRAQLGPADGLARLAADLGYADQAHLTHECRRLTGLTPDALAAAVAHTCRHHDHRASLAPWVGREGVRPARSVR